MANIDVTINPTVTTLEVTIVDSGNTYVVKPVVTNNIGGGGTLLHSGLTLDDGTNPHGTTKADVGLGNVPNTDFTNAVNLNTAKISFDTTSSTRLSDTSGTNTGDQDLSGLALKSNVLELDNTTSFTPDADYEPATKKYVDDNAGGGGSQTLQQTTTLGNTTTDQIEVTGKGQTTGIAFDNQTIHALGTGGLGHTTVQEKTSNNGTRFYLMPKGTPVGDDSLMSGVKLFATDYEVDSANYHDLGMWITRNEIIFNSKKTGTFPKQLPFVWKFQDTNNLLKLQSKTNAALMKGVIAADEKDWTIFEPLHLGASTVLLGRAGVASSEWINNAYYDGSWKRIMAGEAHRYSLDTNGDFVFWTSVDGAADSSVSWIKKFTIKNNGDIVMHSLQTFANDAAAASLASNTVYKTASGELRIKL